MEPSDEHPPHPHDALEHERPSVTTGNPEPRDPFVLCTSGHPVAVGVSSEELSWHGAPPDQGVAHQQAARQQAGTGSAFGHERPHPPGSPQRFAFRFEQPYRIAALPFAVDPEHAYVEVDRPEDPHQPGTLRARFGPWTVETSLDNVEDTHVTGPYRVLKTIGPAHLSIADHGLTFATNHEQGVCIRFREPVAGIEPLGVLRHPALTVTVNDVAGLCAALDRAA